MATIDDVNDAVTALAALVTDLAAAVANLQSDVSNIESDVGPVGDTSAEVTALLERDLIAVAPTGVVSVGVAPVCLFRQARFQSGFGTPFPIGILASPEFPFFVKVRLPGSGEYVDVTADLTPGALATASGTLGGGAFFVGWNMPTTFGNGWQIVIVGDSGSGDGITYEYDWAAKTVTFHYESGVTTGTDFGALLDGSIDPDQLGIADAFFFEPDSPTGATLNSPADDQTLTLAGGVDGSIILLESESFWLEVTASDISEVPYGWTAVYQITGLPAHTATIGEGAYDIGLDGRGFFGALIPLVQVGYQVGPQGAIPGHAITGTLTATSFTTNLSFGDSNAATDMLIRFTSGALAGQVKRVGTSTTGGTITLKTGQTYSGAPSNGDTFFLITE